MSVDVPKGSSAEQDFSELYRVAQSAGRIVAAQFPGIVSADDMAQEAVLWLLEHPQRVEWRRLPTGQVHFKALVNEVITRRLIPLARRERAEVMGSDPADRYTYAVRMVELVLPSVFEEHLPQAVAYGQTYSATDPAERGNFTAMVLDIRRAIDKVCSAEDRKVLFTRAVGGWTWDRFGTVYSRSSEFYRVTYHSALRRIAQYLNDGVVLDDSEDAQLLATALEAEPIIPPLEGDPDEDDWHVAGKDPYRDVDI